MANMGGLDQFENNLISMKERIQGEALKKALLQAVAPTIQLAAAIAPRGRGDLSQSMVAQVMDTPPNEAVIRVGPGTPKGAHGILLEVGTVYMTARPFLAIAYQATFPDVVTLFEDEVLNAL